mmetsp:Transcript_6924/g.12111  ORF Transcript_6924/g.12111 Transcript_6924/m.12111 type:complete len:82 (-) Transcript_6924:105-350(-)
MTPYCPIEHYSTIKLCRHESFQMRKDALATATPLSFSLQLHLKRLDQLVLIWTFFFFRKIKKMADEREVCVVKVVYVYVYY